MPVEGCQHSKRQQRRIVTEINLHQQFNANNKKQQRHVDRIDKKKHEDPLFPSIKIHLHIFIHKYKYPKISSYYTYA